MSGKKQHIIPAALIGRFSSDIETETRSRKVWQIRRGQISAHLKMASQVSVVNRFYDDLDDTNVWKSVDDWGYESPITPLIAKLVHEPPLYLDEFIHVLVPLVSGLFARGQDFNDRYNTHPIVQHLKPLGLLSESNLNSNRVDYLLNLLCPIMASEWEILILPENISAISNERGLAGFFDSKGRAVGWYIPIDKKLILKVTIARRRIIASYKYGSWLANVRYTKLSAEKANEINSLIAWYAKDFIFGCEADYVNSFKDTLNSQLHTITPQTILHPFKVYKIGEYSYHANDFRIVSGIANLNLPPNAALNHQINLEDLETKSKWFHKTIDYYLDSEDIPLSCIGINSHDLWVNTNRAIISQRQSVKLSHEFEKYDASMIYLKEFSTMPLNDK